MITSIVVLTYNELDKTKQCIDSLYEHTKRDDYELIIVDNGSSDGTKAYIQSLSDVIFIDNETNQGFAKGCNQGLKASSGTDVLFLNNDTVLTPNWLEPMRKALHESDQVAMVGPMSNYVSGAQLISVDYEVIEQLDEFSIKHCNQYKGETKRVLRLVGFCLLVKKHLLDEIGGFDERYTMGSFEDDDLSTQMFTKGYELKIVQDSFVHHHGHATFQANQDIDIYDLYIRNKQTFIDKWGADITTFMFPRIELVNLIATNSRKVLEIGCGAGATGLDYRNRNNDVVIHGIEERKIIGKMAQSHFEYVQLPDSYDQIDFTELSSDYDSVVLNNVIEKVVDPWTFIDQISQILKPGGVLVCSVPNVSHGEVIMQLLQGQWTYAQSGMLDAQHVRFFTPYSVDQLFAGDQFRLQLKTYTQVDQDERTNLFLQDVAEAGIKHGFHLGQLTSFAKMHQVIFQLKRTGGE
ncbi:hypothetical protein DH09_15335 [Bacillaceae bacterium JMAK1]|nr:hypothetical protein DH09_15335 [Bacillaceae bacterium JMAK1]